jgi:hypothetical protein
LGPEKPEKYLAEKTIEDVLIHFGDTVREARRRYRQFVKEGVDQGSRPELQGGGLVRSAGGDKRALLGRKKEERELGDARILGSGEFVAEILEEFEKRYQKMHLKPPTLQDLTCKVARQIGLSLKVLLSGTRDRKVSRARAIISYLAAKKAGYTQTQIADHLNISRIGVRNSIIRGQKMIAKCEGRLFFITFIRKVMKIKNKTSCKIQLILSKNIFLCALVCSIMEI